MKSATIIYKLDDGVDTIEIKGDDVDALLQFARNLGLTKIEDPTCEACE